MRNVFAAALVELAAADPRIVLLSGDIGNRIFDPFKERFADRFYNCGVAEANMTGVAAGLALAGLRPLTYTIAPFNTARCYEQIRLDVCYHELPVIIVGVGAGLCYANLGPTHHGLDDIALMRGLPGMTVVCPADPSEVRLALAALVRRGGPAYLRLGKKNEPAVHTVAPAFELGRGIVLRAGADCCLLGTGTVLPAVLEAAAWLAGEGIEAEVVSLHTVKPLDEDLLERVFAHCSLVATVEEHRRSGGLGGAVAEWCADRPLPGARLLRLGVDDAFLHACGPPAEVRAAQGLDARAMARRIRAGLAAEGGVSA